MKKEESTRPTERAAIGGLPSPVNFSLATEESIKRLGILPTTGHGRAIILGVEKRLRREINFE